MLSPSSLLCLSQIIADMSASFADAMRSGARLGGIVSRNNWTSGDALFEDAAAGLQDAVDFVTFLCACRVSVRRPLAVESLLQQYVDTQNDSMRYVERHHRQLYFCLRSFFAVFCAMRRVVTPLRQVSEGHHFHGMSRRDRRLLAPTGMIRHAGQSLTERARLSSDNLWRNLHRSQTVLWMDNFFKLRYGINPVARNTSLNSTAMAVLMNVRPLGQFRGYPTLQEILNRIPMLARSLRSSDGCLNETVRALYGGVEREAVRVPLDVPRGRETGQKWYPWQLSDHLVGTNNGLLNLMQDVNRLQSHTARVLPVLVDENIHYRLMKWMYGRAYARLSVREQLVNKPILYGVWHPYKFLCLHLHRQFLTQFAYLYQGLMNPGDSITAVERLPFIERCIAATWIAGSEFLPRIDEEINRIETFLEGVHTRTTRHRRTVPSSMVSEARWLDKEYEPRRPSHRRRLIPGRLWFLLQLRLLISEYCPAAFVVGHRVRSCTWGHQELGSARNAKDVLEFTTALLIRLSPAGRPTLKYVRTMCTALLTWTPWHDTSPGILHAEESCEALLSKVVRNLHSQTGGTSQQYYQNVFQCVSVAQTTCIRATHVPESVLSAFRQRLSELLSTQCAPPLIRWSPRNHRTIPVLQCPPRVIDDGPLPLLHRLSRRKYEELLLTTLRGLISGQDASADLINSMSQTFPWRPLTEYCTVVQQMQNVST